MLYIDRSGAAVPEKALQKPKSLQLQVVTHICVDTYTSGSQTFPHNMYFVTPHHNKSLFEAGQWQVQHL